VLWCFVSVWALRCRQTPETFDDGDALLEAVCAHGLVGVVAKRQNSSYRPGTAAGSRRRTRDCWRYEMERERHRPAARQTVHLERRLPPFSVGRCRHIVKCGRAKDSYDRRRRARGDTRVDYERLSGGQLAGRAHHTALFPGWPAELGPYVPGLVQIRRLPTLLHHRGQPCLLTPPRRLSQRTPRGASHVPLPLRLRRRSRVRVYAVEAEPALVGLQAEEANVSVVHRRDVSDRKRDQRQLPRLCLTRDSRSLPGALTASVSPARRYVLARPARLARRTRGRPCFSTRS
jgi:hypothetical protein